MVVIIIMPTVGVDASALYNKIKAEFLLFSLLEPWSGIRSN